MEFILVFVLCPPPWGQTNSAYCYIYCLICAEGDRLSPQTLSSKFQIARAISQPATEMMVSFAQQQTYSWLPWQFNTTSVRHR